jgi:hypothetical protein
VPFDIAHMFASLQPLFRQRQSWLVVFLRLLLQSIKSDCLIHLISLLDEMVYKPIQNDVNIQHILISNYGCVTSSFMDNVWSGVYSICSNCSISDAITIILYAWNSIKAFGGISHLLQRPPNLFQSKYGSYRTYLVCYQLNSVFFKPSNELCATCER